MTRTSRPLLALAVLSVACATPRSPSLADVLPPVAYVDTLPPGAVVSVDGVEVGQGSVEFPVRDESRTYVIRATATGFEPAERSVRGTKLAGTRIEIVLRPKGFGTERQLQAGEPAGLLQAAVALLRADRPRDAIAFATASLAAGGPPDGHRVMGQAWRRLGNRELAVKEWSLYLSLAPDAPDRQEVEKAISSAARDIDMTPAKAPRE
jgi:hypothetical protein